MGEGAQLKQDSFSGEYTPMVRRDYSDVVEWVSHLIRLLEQAGRAVKLRPRSEHDSMLHVSDHKNG